MSRLDNLTSKEPPQEVPRLETCLCGSLVEVPLVTQVCSLRINEDDMDAGIPKSPAPVHGFEAGKERGDIEDRSGVEEARAVVFLICPPAW